jgi:hypothetical protein
MSIVYGIFFGGAALVLALWNLWLERKVRELEDQRDTFGSTLVGIAQGKLSIKMENGRPRVSVVPAGDTNPGDTPTTQEK